MHDQPSYQPLESSSFFADGRASRSPVPGTVPRGHLREDTHLYTGRVEGKFSAAFPFPVTLEIMKRGRERYDIFCSPCHDKVGNGQGMVVRRGFSPPPSLHIDRLRSVEAGYLYDVVANGFGRMSGYASQIGVDDRWAVVAYIRALQSSQRVSLTELSARDRSELERQEDPR